MAASRMKVYREHRFPKRLLWLLLPIAVAAAVGFVWWHDTSSGDRGRDVVLTLTDGAGAPLADADVLGLIDTAALPIGEWGQLETRANGHGVLTIGSVLAGGYWLRANGATVAIDVPPTSSGTLRRTVVCEPVLPDVTLRLTDGAGRTLTDTPVRVTPFGLESEPGESFTGTTDWKGDFVWKGAPVGGHLIEPEGLLPTPFVLEPGENRAPSATLACPASRARVAVRLVRGNGKPWANEPVTQVLYGIPGGKEIALGQTRTDGDGLLTLDVAAGEHTLRVGEKRVKFRAPTGDVITLRV